MSETPVESETPHMSHVYELQEANRPIIVSAEEDGSNRCNERNSSFGWTSEG